jgi:hypothetical protein
VGDTFSSSARGSLVVLFVLGLALVSIPLLSASQELVKNGGFETRDFTGWSAGNSKVRLSSKSGTDYEPAHSGKYSARLGTESIEGTISQTVVIPPKSDGKFTAWYRVEKGSGLTIFLKRTDGSVIRQWSVTSITSWTSVVYDLDVSYAGQSVTIEFVGVGHRETVTVTDYCYDPFTGLIYLCPSTEYDDYWPYIDDVSLISTVVAYEADVSVAGLPQELSTKLFVDGAQVATMAAGQSKTLPFLIGENHKISVETYVQKDNQTRYYCASDSATVSSDGPVTFIYKPQFYLSISSSFGTTTGSGWYDEGSKVSFSVDRNTSPMTGLLGMLGARYVFDGWSGDATGGSTQGDTVVSGPKSISALWRADYSIFYIVVALIAALAIGAFLTYTRVLKNKAKPDQTQIYDLEPIPIEEGQLAESTVVKPSIEDA